MSKASRKIESLLKVSSVAIRNALKLDEIKEKIIEYGFDENMLKKGEELLSQTESLYEAQKELRGSQTDFNVRFRGKMSKLRKSYHTFRKLARRELRGSANEGIRNTLGIDGNARFTFTGVLHESRQFYEVLAANEDIQKRLEKFKLTKENIQEKLAELNELAVLYESYQKARGDAQQSTKERDDLYEELNVWMYEFKTVCKDVFADDPQQMEKLGIPAFSESYKRRKAAQNAAEKKEKEGKGVPAATGLQASEKTAAVQQ